MSNVLTSFLVGIGLDTTEFNKGSKEVSSGLDSIKSKALGLGAVVAGAFGLAKLTGDFAGATDKLGKFSQTYSVLANDVAGFGRAIQSQGGDFDAAFSQLEKIEKLRASFLTGETGWMRPQDVAGLDSASIRTSTDALQALLSQADRFKASTPEMRVAMQEALGIDEATARLLSLGREGAADLIQKYKTMRPVTDQATKASAEYNLKLLDLKTSMGALTDQLGLKVLPFLNRLLEFANSTPEEAVKTAQKVVGRGLLDEKGVPVMGQRSAPLSKEEMSAGLKKGNDVPPIARLYTWLSSPPEKGGIDLSGGQSPLIPGGTPMTPRGVTPYYPDMPTGPVTLPLSSAAANRVGAESAAQTQSAQTQRQAPIVVHAHLNLDGREIDNRIVSVNQRGNRSTADDVRSTTSR